MALAAAVALERQGKICTIGVSVVTARDGASAAVAAIGRKWGKAFDVSQYGGKLLACDKIDVYATKLRDLFGAVDASDCAVRFLRKKLATSSDKITLVSIGPLSNIAALLYSNGDDISPLDGVSFVRKKVDALYAMGGNFTHLSGGDRVGEWNIMQDTESAKAVTKHFPVDIIFSPYEIGADILSGSVFHEDDPVGIAIRRFYEVNACENNGMFVRCSWDPITVCQAAGEDLFDLSPRGTVTVDAQGVTDFQQDVGRHRYLIRRDRADVTASKLDALYATLR